METWKWSAENTARIVKCIRCKREFPSTVQCRYLDASVDLILGKNES